MTASLHLSSEKCSLWTATSETTFQTHNKHHSTFESIWSHYDVVNLFRILKRWKRNRKYLVSDSTEFYQFIGFWSKMTAGMVENPLWKQNKNVIDEKCAWWADVWKWKICGWCAKRKEKNSNVSITILG